MQESNMGLLAVIAFLLYGCHACYGHMYLFIPIMMKSHIMEQMIIARELVSRGHEVHMVVPEVFPMEGTIQEAGIKVLRAKKPGEVLKSAYMEEGWEDEFTRMLQDGNSLMTIIRTLNLHKTMINEDCRAIAQDQDLLENIKGQAFDLSLIDSLMFAPCSALIPHHLGIPFASLFSGYVPAGRLPIIPSFVPSPMGPFTDRMSFFERVINTVITGVTNLLPLTDSNSNDLLEILPDPSGHRAKSWTDLITKSSLFLSTRNHILEAPVPSMPYYVMLPGITQHPAKPLDSELENYMTSALRGVFVVSFGSIISDLDHSLIQRLFGAFSTHPDLRFIFRLSESNQKVQENVPSNVRLMTWLPQNDVLGHENTRGFITHCGNNGQHEAVYHGVPMIGIPMFAEQNHNCRRMLVKNLGLCLEVKHFTVEDMSDAIRLLMTDESFRDNVQRLSSIMKEDDLPPTKAAYWMEHVVKYGSGHLRSACLDLPWYQYWLVDVIIFLLTMNVIFCFVLYKCCKRVCCGRELKAKHE